MKSWKKCLEELNPQQYNAVMSDNSRIRLVASAGGGKTKVLTTRAYRLISNRVNPKSILCLTFTRAAGAEMKERLIRLTPGGKNVFCNTFHSFCIDLLRKEGKSLGFDSDFTIMDQKERKALLEDCMGMMKCNKSADKLDSVLSNYFNYDRSQHSMSVNLALDEYLNRLKRYNKIDLDLVLYFAYVLLRDNEEVKARYHEKYEHVLVDEFQDTNDVQNAVIEELNPKNLFIVGDDSQSIYGWRFANMDYILKFDETYPDSETIVLDRNYRSTRPIVDAANKLISHNEHQFKKEMTSDREGAPLQVIGLKNQEEQCKRVAEDVLDISRQHSYSKIAVIARTNKELDQLSVELVNANIPFVMPGKLNSFADSIQVTRVIRILQCCLNPKDDMTLIDVLNMREQVLNSEQVLVSKTKCNESGMSFFDSLQKLKFKNQYKVDEFIRKVLSIRRIIHEDGDSIRTLNASIDTFNLSRNEDLKLLEEDMKEWISKQIQLGESRSISMYLDYFKSREMMDAVKKRNVKEEAVKLFTVHGSKGLEFPVVLLIGMIEGNFPKFKSSSLDEERRLAYTACTRAKDLLNFYHYAERVNYKNKIEECQPSRFLAEATE